MAYKNMKKNKHHNAKLRSLGMGPGKKRSTYTGSVNLLGPSRIVPPPKPGIIDRIRNFLTHKH